MLAFANLLAGNVAALDPITHTFTGAALAAAGLRRATPLATAALLLGANAPDVDGLSYFAGGFESLAFRRGWTHGVLALPLWPFALTGLLLLWDRWVRRRRNRDAAPARAGPLLAVAALAVLTHPVLDWLNNYGMRWLMPFDGKWFYGDALFIIDPWIWLTLGGVLFVRYSNRRSSLARWGAFWALSSLAVLTAPPALVASPVRALWVAALVSVVAIRWLRDKIVKSDAAFDRAAAAALAIVAVYIGAMVGASAAARSQARVELAARGIAGVERVMVAPAAGNPFAGEVVATTADTYYLGRWRWLAEPRLELAPESFPRPRGAVFEAAARSRDAQQYLSWARFPIVDVERSETGSAGADDGYVVRFSDARYRAQDRIPGPTVRLDRNLQLE